MFFSLKGLEESSILAHCGTGLRKLKSDEGRIRAWD
jgi:hypothetical protein